MEGLASNMRAAIPAPMGAAAEVPAKLTLQFPVEPSITFCPLVTIKLQILALAPEERAVAGIFLAFQYPIEIPGISNTNFLKTAINQIRKQKGEEPLDAVAFLKLLKEKAELVKMEPELLHRSLNEGFSGGEKKRNEILQMAVLDPALAILDETDYICSLHCVSEKIQKITKKSHRNASSFGHRITKVFHLFR